MTTKKPLPAGIDHISYTLENSFGIIEHYKIKYLIRIEDGTQRVSCPRYDVLNVAFIKMNGGYGLFYHIFSEPDSQEVLQWVLADLNKS